MKRSLLALLMLGVFTVASAQSTFTIRRPVDGSTVREVVTVRFPRNSVPIGGYVGIFVNGQFLEAVVPEDTGQELVYRLDTKARQIPDGRLNIEAVLFVDFQEQPRIVDRSSVTLNLDNSTSIRVPEGGFRLRYNWTPGREFIYDLSMRRTISYLTRSQFQANRRVPEITLEEERFRFLYAVDRLFENGDGLVRMQPLPPRGQDFAFITPAGATEPRRYWAWEMAPIYMRLTNVGRPVFGSVPLYFPLEGTTGQGSVIDLFGFYFLPVLPSQGVRPGQTWNAPFLTPALGEQPGSELGPQVFERDQITRTLPVRASFLGVEWERGVPCAKLRYTISVNPAAGRGGVLEEIVQEIDELVWFDLRRGIPLRIESTVTVVTPIEAAEAARQVIGSPTRGGGGGPAGGGAPQGGGLPGRGMPDQDEDRSIFQQGGIPTTGGPAQIGRPGASGAGAPTGIGGQRPRGRTAAAAQPAQLARIRFQIRQVLEN